MTFRFTQRAAITLDFATHSYVLNFGLSCYWQRGKAYASPSSLVVAVISGNLIAFSNYGFHNLGL